LRIGRRRRRRHEEESIGTIDGDSSRIRDLVGLLSFDLLELVGRTVEEGSTEPAWRFSRAAEEAL
jgi:hypothetical protein